MGAAGPYRNAKGCVCHAPKCPSNAMAPPTIVQIWRVLQGVQVKWLWLPEASSGIHETENVTAISVTLIHARIALRPARRQLIQALRCGACVPKMCAGGCVVCDLACTCAPSCACMPR